MRPGILFIVVGPSGAGKDTLMDGARKALADSGRFAFARRLITRPADAGGEDHEAIGEVEFAALQAAGGLLASWNAHGLHYGLRASLRDELLRGRHIVANGSRGVLKALAGAVPRLIIINVTASPEVLARRLASRGRETPEDIAARLARRTPDLPDGIETLVVENNGAVEEGVEHFLAAIDAATRRLTLKPVPIDAWRDNIAYLPGDSILGVADFDGPGKVDVAGRLAGEGQPRSIRARINVVDSGWLLEPGEIGLSREAFAELGLPAGSEIELTRTPPQHSRDALRAKIQGRELGRNDYATLLRDIAEGRYPDSEIAAFLVAATRSLSDAEVGALARVRASFSTPLRWDEPIVVDKHSMGGIPGSRITLIVAPIVAAHGLAMPKTSSRAITSAAGTADAMEVLARVDLTADEVRRTVEQARACIAWNGRLNHSAVDDVMNAITRPLGIDSNRWSVASIISKKLTAGATHVAVDLPYGPRAKLRSREEAEELGRLFETVGRDVGLHVEAVATCGAAPIGRGIGPALEVRDVLRVLEGDAEAPPDLREKALDFAGRILSWDPAVGTLAHSRARAAALLSSGAARAALDRIVTAQGRRDPMPKPAALMHPVRAPRPGRIGEIDGWRIGGIARRAGAPFDKGAGIDLLRRVGDEVAAGEALFVIHASAAPDLEAAVAMAAADDGFVLG
ncbi:thymidine phosphorylase [Bosea sp. Root381]|uniref:phosphonate metabolism protein/1,5-bisphosphokinase (PRPP-forming) PhnN n=1 Tax=Bosea sp. Root381 TaxID=1736524 RepID=UPI0006FED934|nr:phosphonate metabolism protein/1,5-bisphosphokinase (PRPP-forming) PhnN [Bosea sp. Root381]KRE09557.1 thymidine phosphorylase [Bosea sp. Root381]